MGLILRASNSFSSFWTEYLIQLLTIFFFLWKISGELELYVSPTDSITSNGVTVTFRKNNKNMKYKYDSNVRQWNIHRQWNNQHRFKLWKENIKRNTDEKERKEKEERKKEKNRLKERTIHRQLVVEENLKIKRANQFRKWLRANVFYSKDSVSLSCTSAASCVKQSKFAWYSQAIFILFQSSVSSKVK